MKTILKTAVSLFLICAVSAGILALVNSVTAQKIDAIAAEKADAARSEVLPAAVSFEEANAPDGTAYYVGKNAAGETVGCVFTTCAGSYGGKLELMTGVGADGAVTGVNILTIDDTPGLGMKAKTEAFRGQYPGKSGTLSVIKNGEPGENEIAAITSATITSNAVTSCVNQALALFETVRGEG